MRSLKRTSSVHLGLGIAVCCLFAFILGIIMTTPHARADTQMTPNGERLITIHDNGQDKGIITRATTLRQALGDAHISVDSNDLVEPGLDEVLAANNYEVNIYRARPITVVDGSIRTKIMSPYQTAKQIADHASIPLHDEDKTTIAASTDMIASGAGLQLTIDRATQFTLMLYGTKTTVYTQEKTVKAMLASKNITIAPNDTLSVPESSAMTANMTIEIWRNGKQTATQQQDVPFSVQQVQNTDQPVGYKKVQTPGIPGKMMVTYEIEMKNGQEVSRKQIQSVTILAPVSEVDVVGTKNNYSGSVQDWLLALRTCESHGNYADNTGNGYYGAYQFSAGTWNSLNTGYAYAYLAPPSIQDAMIILNTNRSTGGLATQNPGCMRSQGLSAKPPQ